MWAGLRSAITATTDTILTLAHPTVTTGLTGSRAVCSLAPVLGTAGAAAGDMVGGAAGVTAITGVAATAGVVVVAITDAQDMVGEGMADEVTPDAATRVVGSEVTRSTAEAVASTVEEPAGSTVVVADSTVAAVATAAADIGNGL